MGGGGTPHRRILLFCKYVYILKLFSLSSCQYVRTVPKKETTCYRPFKNRHFIRVCKEKIMDHQYRKTVRETYIQTIIRRELMLNAPQINKKILPYQPFHQAIDETIDEILKIPFLYLNFNKVIQFSSTSQGL